MARRETRGAEHDHAVTEGDQLNHDCGDEFVVTAVNVDGSVDVELVSDEHDVNDTWTEEAVRVGLLDGDLTRDRDGKNSELASI